MKNSIILYMLVSLLSCTLVNAQYSGIDRDEITRTSSSEQFTQVVEEDVFNLMVGTWEGEDQGDKGTFIFDENGYAIIITMGEVIGGDDFYISGVKSIVEYRIELNEKSGNHDIDLIVRREGDNSLISMLPGIFRFDGEDTMQLCLNFEGNSRPGYFIDEDSVTLNRIK